MRAAATWLLERRGTCYCVLLCVLACAAIAASACVPVQDSAYRWVFMFSIPLVMSVMSFAFRGLAGKVVPRSDRKSWRVRLAWVLLVVVLWFSGLSGVLAGYGLDMISFTYGDQYMVESLPRIVAWALPVLLVLATLGWELALRKRMPEALGRFGFTSAAGIGVLLSVPWIVAGFEVRSVPFLVTSLVGLLSMECTCTILFCRGGGLILAGIVRGVVMLTIGFVLSDWHGVFFTAFTYVTTGTADYVLIGGGYLLAPFVALGGSAWIAKM